MGAGSMGVAEGSAEAVARQVLIAQHVRNVIAARAMSPAEQVRVLMMAAASVIVTHSCGQARDAAVVRAMVELTVGVSGAAAAVDEALAAMVPEGTA